VVSMPPSSRRTRRGSERERLCMEAVRGIPTDRVLETSPSTSPRAARCRHVKQPRACSDAAHLHQGRSRASGRRTATVDWLWRRQSGPAADRDDGGELSAEGRRGRPAAPQKLKLILDHSVPEGGHEPE